MYSRGKTCLIFSFFLVIAMAMSSCASFDNPLNITYPKSTQEFKNEINRYRSVISDKISSNKKKSKAHLRLGLLYAHHRNQWQDYDKALEHIERSISMDKGSTTDDNVTNLLVLLKSITGKDTGKISAYRRLKRENSELKSTLKKLNELEVEQERKRRLMR